MYHVMSRGDRRERILLDAVEFAVHLNPVWAGMLKAEKRLLSYPRSSFGASIHVRPGASASLGAGGPTAGRARILGGRAVESVTVRAVDGTAAAGGDISGGTRCAVGRKTANRSLHRYVRGGGAASVGQRQLGI